MTLSVPMHLEVVACVLTIFSGLLAFVVYLYPQHTQNHDDLKEFFKLSRMVVYLFLLMLLSTIGFLYYLHCSDESMIKTGNEKISALINDSTSLANNARDFQICLEQTQARLQLSLDSNKEFDQELDLRVGYCLDCIKTDINRCKQTTALLEANDTIIKSTSILSEQAKQRLLLNSTITRQNIAFTKKSLKGVAKQLQVIMIKAKELQIENSQRVFNNNESKFFWIAQN